MTMDITTMGMDTITTTINHHMLTPQTCPRNPLLGHEKAMLSYNGSMAFLFPYRLTHLFPLLFCRRPLLLTRTLRIANIFQVIPFAIEAENICLT